MQSIFSFLVICIHLFLKLLVSHHLLHFLNLLPQNQSSSSCFLPQPWPLPQSKLPTELVVPLRPKLPSLPWLQLQLAFIVLLMLLVLSFSVPLILQSTFFINTLVQLFLVPPSRPTFIVVPFSSIPRALISPSQPGRPQLSLSRRSSGPHQPRGLLSRSWL